MDTTTRQECVDGLTAPAVWATNHSWPTARRAALARDAHRCRRCGRGDLRLHVHHVVPARGDRTPGCQHHQANLLTLCEHHHAEEHRFLRSDLRPYQLTLLPAA